MGERLKTIILCFLVFLSLVLTYRLWFGSPDYEVITPVSYERINFGETVSLDKLLLPGEIVYFHPQAQSYQETEISEGEFSNNRGYYQEEEPVNLRDSLSGYSSLWEAFNRELKKVHHINFSSVNEKEIKKDLNSLSEPSLQIHFSVPYALELFLPSGINDISFPLIQKIYFYGEETYMETVKRDYYRIDWDFNYAYFLSQAEELFLKQSPDFTLLNLLVEGNEEINSYLVTEEIAVLNYSPDLPDLYYQIEELDIDKLAKAFFIDLTLVRQIKERDEAVIYTDGQRGLRVNSQGLIEYSAPAKKHEPEVLSYQEALIKGIEYVTVYGGWPEILNLKITELSSLLLESEGFYRLKLNSYYKGFPIIFGYTPLDLVFNKQGLVSYQRQIFELEVGQEKSKVIGVEKALEGILNDLPELFSQKSSRKVTRCFLAYIPVQGVNRILRPYWIIEIDNYYRVLLNGRTGAVDKVITL